jgi:hypothetical protein
MRTANIIAGLTILSRHSKDKYTVSAEHDAIHHYPVKGLSDSEVAELLELGWFQHDGAIRAEDADDGIARPYEPDEGWQAFT